MDRVRELTKVMEQREKELLSERTTTMNKFASFTTPLIVTAALIALLITGLFYIRVRNDFSERLQLQLELEQKDADISKRITIINAIAEQISEGSCTARIDDKESDTLGSVAESLNKMAGSLE